HQYALPCPLVKAAVPDIVEDVTGSALTQPLAQSVQRRPLKPLHLDHPLWHLTQGLLQVLPLLLNAECGVSEGARCHHQYTQRWRDGERADHLRDFEVADDRCVVIKYEKTVIAFVVNVLPREFGEFRHTGEA